MHMSIISIYLLKPVAHAEAALRGSEQHSNNTDLTFTSRTLNKLKLEVERLSLTCVGDGVGASQSYALYISQ